MSDDRYSRIFKDFKNDLISVAKRHGKRALREAVRDAANGNLIQEEDPQGEDESEETDNEPDFGRPDLDYPDEDTWTVPPAPDDEEEESDSGDEEEQSTDDEHELSDAAERVLDRLMDTLEDRAGK